MSENLACLEELTRRPSAVKWFKGLFHRIHVRLTDTDEAFTVTQQGDAVTVEPGLKGEANFVIPLESENVKNLASFFSDDAITPQEEFRIVKFLLRPCLEAGLGLPILQNSAFRKVVRMDTHWQEALLDPDGNEDEQLTVVCVNNQWLILPGYHGKAQRRLVLRPDQVLDYQRRVFEAAERNSLPSWLEVGKWYKGWRDEVSVSV
jgi:hypothetical protein